MSDPLILVTGFGPFEEVEENPSGRLAERLDADPPPRVEIASRILPVSFRGAGSEIDAALTALEPRRPDAMLLMGVYKKGERFRLERRATTALKAGRPDVLGLEAEALSIAEAPDLETGLDVDALVAALEGAGATDVEVSEDAGGYVCERAYRHAMERGVELTIPTIFLHVPPIKRLGLDQQLRPVRALVTELARQATAAAPG